MRLSSSSCSCWKSAEPWSGGSALCGQPVTLLSAPQQAAPPPLRKPGSYLPLHSENSREQPPQSPKAREQTEPENASKEPPTWGVWEAAGAGSDTRRQKSKLTEMQAPAQKPAVKQSKFSSTETATPLKPSGCWQHSLSPTALALDPIFPCSNHPHSQGPALSHFLEEAFPTYPKVFSRLPSQPASPLRAALLQDRTALSLSSTTSHSVGQTASYMECTEHHAVPGT